MSEPLDELKMSPAGELLSALMIDIQVYRERFWSSEKFEASGPVWEREDDTEAAYCIVRDKWGKEYAVVVEPLRWP